MTGVVQTIMTLLLWFSLNVSGVSGQGKSWYDGMCSENYLLNLEDFNSMEKPKETDLQVDSLLLDATLVAAFALFAALFFPPAAMLDAAHDRGSAQPGFSPVVLPPPPEATAFAWAVAPVAFSHLGGLWTR